MSAKTLKRWKMTREEAIQELEFAKAMCEFDPTTGEVGFRNAEDERQYEAFSMAIEALQAQATLDDVSTAYENGYKQGKFEATQWIPVSDHLPEKNGEYLVTVGKDSRFAFNGEATVYEDYFQFLCQWDDCGEDVIAWMEMPDPYTEEEQ